MSQLYQSCLEHGINPMMVDEYDMNIISNLWLYFHDIDQAVEAFKEGYTAEELKNKGPYPPYWVYLLWVKK